MKCPFCQLLHDPEKSHCNDPRTGALIRRKGPIEETAHEREFRKMRDLLQAIYDDGTNCLADEHIESLRLILS